MLQHGLDGLLILGSVILENARANKSAFSSASKNLCDSFWRLIIPIRTYQHIEAGFTTVHLAKLRKGISTQIHYLINPKPVAKVWHLDHYGRNIKCSIAGTINYILVGTGDR